MGMPWTIPNLVLQAKPVPLANMRTHGRRHVFVNCGNPDCYYNAELRFSGLPDMRRRRFHVARQRSLVFMNAKNK